MDRPEAELPRRHGRRQAGGHQLERRRDLIPVERLATGPLAASPGSDDAILGAFGDQPALEVRDGAEHVEHQLARGRAGVDPLLQADERDAALLQHRHRREQLGERPTQAVEPDDGERVAAARVVEQGGRGRVGPWNDRSGRR